MQRRHLHSFKGGVQRFGAILASACLIGGGAVGLLSSQAGAESVSSGGFESFTPGSVNAQGGWSSTGPYDQAIVNTASIPGAPASFGTKALRISDGVTSGNFADQTYSKPTANQAGEPGAQTGGFPVGQLQSTFISSFDFASTTPAVEQPGLHMSVSPDRSDGARMSYVRIDDSPTGFQLTFDPYVDAAPFATPGNLDNGCGAEDGWPEIPAATDISRGPHNLKFVMQFVPGPHNDVVTILLDGNVVAIGRSWEDYFRDCAEQTGGDGGALADKSRTVRNLEFRESGDADAANAGKGFLIDNLEASTISPAAAPTHLSGVPGNGSVKLAWTGVAASGGNAITGYVVTTFKGGVAQGTQTFDPSTTAQVIGGLKNKTAYTFKVAATNALGTGAQSAPTGLITAGAPGRPGKVKASLGAKSGHIKVTFNAPVSNGSKITAFNVLCKSSNGGALATGKRVKSPVGVGGATVGKKYTCTVIAKNARGIGPVSLPSNSLTVS